MKAMLKTAERPVNLVKLIAEEKLPHILEKLNLPDTEEVREDVLAITLNSVPTKYVTSVEGKQYAQLVEVYRIQYEADVVSALTKAGIKVKGVSRDESHKDITGEKSYD
jgi:competence protein ComFB